MGNLFIKAAEVWLPDKNGLFLSRGSSYYGPEQHPLAAASKDFIFRYNEGLPGITWAQHRPLIWNDLTVKEFLRTESALEAGVSCAISIPIFSGQFLLAVLVMFCSKDEMSGAVEVWNNPNPASNELRLVEGYYGKLKRFEFISRHLTLMKGRGLPGIAWSSMMPVIMENIGESNTFVRARNAKESGITTGLAIPLYYPDETVQVVAFLSANGSPIARSFEVWAPNEDESGMVFVNGSSVVNENLHDKYEGALFSRDTGAVGEVWLSGRPLVQMTDARAEVLIPAIYEGKISAIVKLEI